jgi:hypothetical protein
MNDIGVLRRLAIAGVLLAVILVPVSVVLGMAATDGDFDALVFGDPTTVLGAGAKAAPLWRWAMLLDMLDSYLLLVPLALFVHRRMRDRRPWLADLGLIGALAYIFLGGASAAILGIAGSSLIENYAAAPLAEQPAIATSFRLLRDIFYFGIWQTLDGITAGTWILTTGGLLLSDRPLLGRILVMLGAAAWLAALMTALDVHSLAVWAAIFAGALFVAVGWFALARTLPGLAGRQA